MDTLITGGSRGIGAAMVRAFAARGDRVFFTYLEHGDIALRLAEETGAVPFYCDVRSEESVRQLFSDIAKKSRMGIENMICNAGTAYSGLLQEMSVHDFDDLTAVHLRGAFLCAKYALPGMISAQRGSIVFISSVWGRQGASCEVAYSACKAGLIGLTKALAREVGPSGIRVNCICPGVIETDMLSSFTQADKDVLCAETPLGRLGMPLDVAKAALFLCSSDASFITSDIIDVGGGFPVP